MVNILRQSDRLNVEVEDGGSFRVQLEQEGADDAGRLVQWDVMFNTEENFYFEVTLKELTARGVCAIGLCTSQEKLDDNFPGWGRMSYGYHSDDGDFFLSNGEGTEGGARGQSWGVNDTVGLGLWGGHLLYFSLNGVVVDTSVHLPSDVVAAGLYPTVALDANGVASVNAGTAPFQYQPPVELPRDIMSHILALSLPLGHTPTWLPTRGIQNTWPFVAGTSAPSLIDYASQGLMREHFDCNPVHVTSKDTTFAVPPCVQRLAELRRVSRHWKRSVDTEATWRRAAHLAWPDLASVVQGVGSWAHLVRNKVVTDRDARCSILKTQEEIMEAYSTAKAKSDYRFLSKFPEFATVLNASSECACGPVWEVHTKAQSKIRKVLSRRTSNKCSSLGTGISVEEARQRSDLYQTQDVVPTKTCSTCKGTVHLATSLYTAMALMRAGKVVAAPPELFRSSGVPRIARNLQMFRPQYRGPAVNAWLQQVEDASLQSEFTNAPLTPWAPKVEAYADTGPLPPLGSALTHLYTMAEATMGEWNPSARKPGPVFVVYTRGDADSFSAAKEDLIKAVETTTDRQCTGACLLAYPPNDASAKQDDVVDREAAEFAKQYLCDFATPRTWADLRCAVMRAAHHVCTKGDTPTLINRRRMMKKCGVPPEQQEEPDLCCGHWVAEAAGKAMMYLSQEHAGDEAVQEALRAHQARIVDQVAMECALDAMTDDEILVRVTELFAENLTQAV